MRSDGRSLLAALALHGAAVLGARAMRPPEAPPRPAQAAPVEVEIEAAPPAPAAAATGESEAAAAPAAIAARAQAAARGGAPRAPEATPIAEGLPAPPAPAPAPASSGAKDGYDAPEGDRGSGDGVIGTPGGISIWGAPGMLTAGPAAPGAPTAAPAPRAPERDVAGRVIREELHQRDKEKGIDLPAAGTVASTVATAVLGSTTPNESRATFAIRLDGAGRVLGVSVVNATDGDAAAWSRVASAVSAQLAAKKLLLTGEYAGGAVVTVTTTSVVQLPAGTKSGRGKRLLHESNAPPVEVSGSGMGATGTVRGDLSEIGAHLVRVVTTRFSVQPAR